MAVKHSVNTGAVIHIGSNGVRLRIAQVKKGEVEELERLDYPLPIGHEVFSTHRISYTTTRAICRVIKGFLQLLDEYKVKNLRAVAASALRDADNRALVVDQVRVQCGITVEILENSQEKSIIYFKMAEAVRAAVKEVPQTVMYAFVGSGTIGFAFEEKGQIVYSQNIYIGALKLHDMLASVRENTSDFGRVIEEYLQATLEFQSMIHLKGRVDRLVISGSSLEKVAKIAEGRLENGVYRVDARNVKNLYEQVKNRPAYQLTLDYKIPESSAELLFSVLAIYLELIGMTGVAEVMLPRKILADGIMEQMMLPMKRKKYKEYVQKNAVSCAWSAAYFYECHEAHTKFVEKMALELFDRLKKLHGLGEQERLMLQLAAILHGCGGMVSARHHLSATYDIVRQLDIYGITRQELVEVARIARYDEYAKPDFADKKNRHDDNERDTVLLKLIAIFRIAGALDVSYRQKIKAIKVNVKETEVIVTADAREGTQLEKWAFDQCTDLFKAVFGLWPVLKSRHRLLKGDK